MSLAGLWNAFLLPFVRRLLGRASPSPACVTVGYVSDVEGSLDYWQRYKAISKVLVQTADGEPELRPDCHLVFGGDACDRGPGSMRVTRELLGLKRRHPSRVHLILGNRDINKMRLPVELHAGMQGAPLECFWINGAPPVPLNDAAARLRWVLVSTMGAPDAFAYRAQELLELGEPCDDAAVVRSFLRSAGPEGELTALLREGVLGVQLHDTLFVHGALQTDSIGKVADSSERLERMHEWLSALNAFAAEEAAAFAQDTERYLAALAQPRPEDCWSSVGGFHHPQPGSRLLQYGMGEGPGKKANPTVVYSKFQAAPSEEVQRYCAAARVRRVVVGHEPRGDAPLTIALPALQVLCADTSYSADVLWGGAASSEGSVDRPLRNTRGAAVCEVLLTVPAEAFGTDLSVPSSVALHGVLSDGTAFDHARCPAPLLALVGSEAGDGWVVKVIVAGAQGEQARAMLSRRHGLYGVENKLVSIDSLSYKSV